MTSCICHHGRVFALFVSVLLLSLTACSNSKAPVATEVPPKQDPVVIDDLNAPAAAGSIVYAVGDEGRIYLVGQEKTLVVKLDGIPKYSGFASNKTAYFVTDRVVVFYNIQLGEIQKSIEIIDEGPPKSATLLAGGQLLISHVAGLMTIYDPAKAARVSEFKLSSPVQEVYPLESPYYLGVYVDRLVWFEIGANPHELTSTQLGNWVTKVRRVDSTTILVAEGSCQHRFELNSATGQVAESLRIYQSPSEPISDMAIGSDGSHILLGNDSIAVYDKESLVTPGSVRINKGKTLELHSAEFSRLVGDGNQGQAAVERRLGLDTSFANSKWTVLLNSNLSDQVSSGEYLFATWRPKSEVRVWPSIARQELRPYTPTTVLGSVSDRTIQAVYPLVRNRLVIIYCDGVAIWDYQKDDMIELTLNADEAATYRYLGVRPTGDIGLVIQDDQNDAVLTFDPSSGDLESSIPLPRGASNITLLD